jgi:hypothetical protein
MGRLTRCGFLALLVALVLPTALALADALNLTVDPATITGGTGTVQAAGNGVVFVNLDPSASSALTYTFELNTWSATQGGQHPTYPLAATIDTTKLSGDIPAGSVKLLVKTAACDSLNYSGASSSLGVSYPGAGGATTNNVVVCVQAAVPDLDDLTKHLNQIRLQADAGSVQFVQNGQMVVIRIIKPESTSSGLFWISTGPPAWQPQEEWNFTDAAGASLGPDKFGIVANRTKISSTNPGQFYANLWLPGVTASNLTLNVQVPQGFCLSADPSGVSTKLFVGSSNISFTDPTGQTEYKRNHDFTLAAGAISAQDVYLIAHLNYCQTDPTGLQASTAYEFFGKADADGALPLDYELATLQSTIYGVLKK